MTPLHLRLPPLANSLRLSRYWRQMLACEQPGGLR
jgi:hypothetical protein